MIAKSIARLLGCLALCIAIGLVGSVSTMPEIPTWYAALVKPSWTPPPPVFPVVWTILYILMAIALWLLWDRTQPSVVRSQAITAFMIQLALNAVWSPVFFSLHATGIALIIIAALFGAIAATIAFSARVNRAAAWLLAPYLIWVGYAVTINAGVVWLN